MASINILHLSDLHLSGKRLSNTSKKLIVDIEKQTSFMDKVLVVVSGDIVDKGDYTKNRNVVLCFFDALKQSLGSKIVDIFFVPGNHDKERSVSNRLYGQLSRIHDLEIDEDVWRLQSNNYKAYLELVQQIKKSFKLKCKKRTETFGIEYCKVEDYIICFVEIDTTWGTFGGNEEGKLVLGKYQLNSLLKQYEDIKGELEEKGRQISLTIGIGHHPISWLNCEQNKKIRKYMIDEEYFNMNLYLCGHIHDMNVENWYNSEHSLMTLVTGIGWDHRMEDENNKDKKDEHRYSLYMIDIPKNSCDIIMRKSQNNGHFIFDYSVYVNDDESNLGKLCYPLKMQNSNHPFIIMNAPNKDVKKSLFVDANLIEVIKFTHNSMVSFRKKTVELLQFYKRNYIERLTDVYKGDELETVVSILNSRFFSGDKNDKEVIDIFLMNINIIYEQFTAFLQDLLGCFVNYFEQCFPDNSDIRVHFRWYKKEEDKYLKLCQYSNIDQNDGPSVSEISWGGLIEQSYNLNNSLIYSINPQYNNHRPLKWDDFMTLVPSFLNCEQEFRDSQNKKVKRPKMTFGISVRNTECRKDELSKTLYVLEYLDIYRLISDTLDDYIRDFIVDYSKYLIYIEEQRRMNG